MVEGHLKVHVNHVVRTGDRQHVVAHGVQVQQVDRQLKNQDIKITQFYFFFNFNSVRDMLLHVYRGKTCIRVLYLCS